MGKHEKPQIVRKWAQNRRILCISEQFVPVDTGIRVCSNKRYTKSGISIVRGWGRGRMGRKKPSKPRTERDEDAIMSVSG